METIAKHKLRPSKSFTEQHPILGGDAITGTAIPKKVYYELWNDLIGKVGISTENRTLTL